MIEVFDAKRTRSYGCFASFKAATDTLDSLAATGQLGSVPAVSVAAYCSGVLQREYDCLLYTSPSPRELSTSRMPSSA